MRVARRSSPPLLAAALLAFAGGLCPRAFAAGSTAADSSVAEPTRAAPDSSATPSAAPDSIFTICPLEGECFQVDYVGSWTIDTIRYRKVSGETGYLAAARIRTLDDAEGNDRLAAILRERKSYGVWTGHHQLSPRSLREWLGRPFRAVPDRERRWCLVGEFGVSTRPDDGVSTGDGGTLLESAIGGIRNLSPRWGVGGVARFATDARGYHAAGAGVRVRRYLSRRFTIETTQGLFSDTDQDGRRQRGIPYFGEVALTGSSVLSLFMRVEKHGYVYDRLTYGFFPEEVEVSETAIHAGIRIGPRPPYLAVPAAVAGTLVTLLDSGERVIY